MIDDACVLLHLMKNDVRTVCIGCVYIYISIQHCKTISKPIEILQCSILLYSIQEYAAWLKNFGKKKTEKTWREKKTSTVSHIFSHRLPFWNAPHLFCCSLPLHPSPQLSHGKPVRNPPTLDSSHAWKQLQEGLTSKNSLVTGYWWFCFKAKFFKSWVFFLHKWSFGILWGWFWCRNHPKAVRPVNIPGTQVSIQVSKTVPQTSSALPATCRTPPAWSPVVMKVVMYGSCTWAAFNMITVSTRKTITKWRRTRRASRKRGTWRVDVANKCHSFD